MHQKYFIKNKTTIEYPTSDKQNEIVVKNSPGVVLILKNFKD